MRLEASPSHAWYGHGTDAGVRFLVTDAMTGPLACRGHARAGRRCPAWKPAAVCSLDHPILQLQRCWESPLRREIAAMAHLCVCADLYCLVNIGRDLLVIATTSASRPSWDS